MLNFAGQERQPKNTLKEKICVLSIGVITFFDDGMSLDVITVMGTRAADSFCQTQDKLIPTQCIQCNENQLSDPSLLEPGTTCSLVCSSGGDCLDHLDLSIGAVIL